MYHARAVRSHAHPSTSNDSTLRATRGARDAIAHSSSSLLWPSTLSMSHAASASYSEGSGTNASNTNSDAYRTTSGGCGPPCRASAWHASPTSRKRRGAERVAAGGPPPADGPDLGGGAEIGHDQPAQQPEQKQDGAADEEQAHRHVRLEPNRRHLARIQLLVHLGIQLQVEQVQRACSASPSGWKDGPGGGGSASSSMMAPAAKKPGGGRPPRRRGAIRRRSAHRRVCGCDLPSPRNRRTFCGSQALS